MTLMRANNDMDDTQFPDDLKPHVLHGERLIWRAKPERQLFVRRYQGISGLGLMMVGIMVFWFIVSLVFAGSLEPVIHNLVFFWAIPSLVVGGLLIYGPLFLAAREWGNTEYFLTDRRLIIRRGVIRPHLSVIALNRLPRIEVESDRGWGHVVLLGDASIERLGEGGRLEYQPGVLRLHDLREPGDVKRRILDASQAMPFAATT